MDDAYKFFTEMLTEMRYVVPHSPKWDPAESHPATSLRMEEVNWSDYNKNGDDVESHFVCAKDTDPFPITPEFLKTRFMAICNEIKQSNLLDLDAEVAACFALIKKSKRFQIEEGEINEANVRMVYGNAIILMMCGLHKYKYWVEDKMSKIEGETLYEKGITPKSTADYVCFDVYEGVRLAVVLLEAKVQKALKMKSIAQVIGYFIRSASSSVKPAVCFVVTEQTVTVVLFPFVDPDFPEFSLINAIWLKTVCYTNNITGILYLIAILSHRKFECLLPLHKKLRVHHKGHHYLVKSAYDDKIKKLEEEVEQKNKRIIEVEKSNKEMEEELLKLKCIMNNFTVKLKPIKS